VHAAVQLENVDSKVVKGAATRNPRTDNGSSGSHNADGRGAQHDLDSDGSLGSSATNILSSLSRAGPASSNSYSKSTNTRNHAHTGSTKALGNCAG
jgi:hypothetical protein